MNTMRNHPKETAPPDSGQPHKKVLGVFSLAMMNLALVCTLRGLPIMAEEGFSLVFYYLVTVLVFVIPVSFVSAELATSWPPSGPGGVYIWVKEAFGERWGFVAVWLQWIQNVIWFPTALSFIAGTIAYIFLPELAGEKAYMVLVILVVYWAGTLVNLRGMKTSSAVSTICVIGGVFLPGALLIALGAAWLAGGNSSDISFSIHTFFPDFSNIDHIVFLAGAFLIFAGIEVSAVHTNTVHNPKRNFPRAILLSSGIAVLILTLGSLAIAVVVPRKEISLVAGIMQAFHLILLRYHMEWMAPVIALLISLGSMGEISTWIAGPSKGLHITARDGILPSFLQYTNRHGVASRILLIQACIVSVLSLIFLLMPTINSSYWILSALCVILYLLMYLLFYASALRLRYKEPDAPRPYRIPLGNLGMWVACLIGISGALFAFVVGFFPPSQLDTGSTLFYELFLIVGVVVIALIPLLIYRAGKSSWKQRIAG